jgi:hypothetical protein
MSFALVLEQLTPKGTGKLQGSGRIEAAQQISFVDAADFPGLRNVYLVLGLSIWSIADKHAL